MKLSQRRAVSPIIATLLLIAISVASGIVVYVFTNGLAANLTKSGGNQVTEQVSMVAYNYATPATGLTIYIQNTGSASITLSSVYFDGTSVVIDATSTCGGGSLPGTIDAQSTCSIILLTATYSQVGATPQTSHAVKAVTSDGATFNFNVVAGQTG